MTRRKTDKAIHLAT